MEAVVAKIEQFEGQFELTEDITRVVKQAETLVIVGESAREEAHRLLGLLAAAQSTVKDKIKVPKADAARLHKFFCQQEKTMLEPLENAEKLLKRRIAEDLEREERQRREEAERLRLLAREEAESKLAEASAAAEAGDEAGATMSLFEAEVYEQAAQSTRAEAVVKPKGTVETWEIVSVDNEKVPVMFSGMELRPVNESAVKQLIRASKGTIQIPGIVYKKTYSIRSRK